MINFRNSWMCTSIVIGVFLMISCEKTDVSTETLEIQENDFTSITGNDDQTLNLNNKEVQEPLLHLSFDKNTNEQEIDFLWNKAVKDYIHQNPITNKNASTEVFILIRTLTGEQENHDTTANARARIEFTTDQGQRISRYLLLNNGTNYDGSDNGPDRQIDQYDFYLFRIGFPNLAICWFELNTAHLESQGMDNWFVREFNLYVQPDYQTISATGRSVILSDPNEWLEGETETDWDQYHTGIINSGTLDF
ncbi:hypothetical protein [Aquimarina sp. LLG6339-5]|uniref:hypothetical protein n=1 Tax=Aquimarina sp. LLG6339-5 TaxID=3160830 RepID=UPI00386A5187